MGTVVDMRTWRKREMSSVFDVAAYLLSKESMNNKKLQKMCFYVQSWSMALNNKKIFASPFEAWVHGPVCADLYYAYRNWGTLPIPRFKDVDKIVLSEDDRKLIDAVYDSYGKLNGEQLEALTHSEKPWLTAREGLNSSEYSRQQIDDQLMKDCCLEKIGK